MYLLGEVKLLNVATKTLLNVELLKEEHPTSVKWSHKHHTLAAIGYKSGRVSFVDVSTLETCTLELFKEENESASQGQSLINNLVGEAEGLIGEGQAEVSHTEVVDMAWD
jgi:hypothetical protein